MARVAQSWQARGALVAVVIGIGVASAGKLDAISAAIIVFVSMVGSRLVEGQMRR